jgi:hypothetical protein
MKDLYSYIQDKKYKLSDKDKEYLLELDKEYGKLYKEFWSKWDRTDCMNTEDEFNKFMEMRKKHLKYYPQLKLVRDELDENWLTQALDLRTKITKFDCFLSQYYIENIDYMYDQVNMTVHKDNPYLLTKYNQTMVLPVSDYAYDYAWGLIKNHPYIDKRDEQPFRGKDVLPKMISHMKKRGFGFNVELNPYMIARQNVEPHNQVLHIKTDAYFSQLDVESLRIHEIDVHVARRFYGLKMGLNLMCDGLLYRNTLDEGLAINQSLHHNKFGVKPNLEFDIAIKTIIGRHILEMDFCELFDFLIDKIRTDENKDIIDFILFKNICRFKRTLQDCKKMGGDSHGETDYLLGYLQVHNMSSQERDDILKYNIGPGQLKDLPKIKKFFELNHFDSLM